MKLPKRFALSSLLMVMLVVASVFGYAQWRRQSLISEANDLREKGVVGITVNDSWFWPEVRQYAFIRCLSYSPTIYSPPSFKTQDAVVSAEEAYLFYADIAERLDDLGIENDRITFRWDHCIAATHHGKEFRGVQELTRPFFDEYGR